VFENPIHVAPSHEILDLRLLWNDSSDRYTIIGFVKNADNEDAYLRATGFEPSPAGAQSRDVGLVYPRTYGVELQYRFGN
jgi:iron complex outermembrane recepter protein